MFHNLPYEMRHYPQWVVWQTVTLDGGRVTKVPYDPKAQRMASVTDPSTWSDYDTAVRTAMNTGMGVGFVFTQNDPFCGVDLDDPYAVDEKGNLKNRDPEFCRSLQMQLFNGMSTYAELSPSGKGLHMITKGAVRKGRRRHAIEVYSEGRFFTMTGNVYNPSPITEQQPALDWLYEQLGGEVQQYQYTGTFEDKETDEVVYNRAINAENGQKFIDLFNGEWQRYYPSQSEADFALINIFAFYTTSRFQIMRLFRLSGLGQREKAKRDAYLNGMIDRSFDRHLPPIDIDGLRERLEEQMQTPAKPVDGGSTPSEESGSVGIAANPTVTPAPEAGNPYLQPVPGLVGQVAYWIFRKSPRPVPEIALAAALALVSGIAGRAYNVSGTGLNQYIMVLAPTGRGKEVITTGINALMNAVADVGPGKGGCPGAREFMGPERIASGQALIKHLDKTSRSFVSIMGEFDNTLKTFTSRNANAALIALKQSLLSLYSRSGRGNTVNPTIYSDKDKNTAPISAPAVTIIGEGTPDRFYALLDETLVSDGLLPRFTIIEYNGKRPPLNHQAERVEPEADLVQALAQLSGYALMLNQSGTVLDVQYEPVAKSYLDAFNQEADNYINHAQNETIAELWNRAHLKALKLAAVLSVGTNYLMPTISPDMAAYAINCVRYDTQRLVDRFTSGDVGEGENKQMADMKRKIKAYIDNKIDYRLHGIPKEAWDNRLFNYTYVARACSNLASFKADRMGAKNAIKATINELVAIGALVELGAGDIAKFNGGRVRWFAVKDLNLLD